MLSKEAVIVLRHYLQEGLTKTAIARKLGITRRTVQRYVKNGKDEPRYGPRLPRGSKLDAYKPYLRERLTIYPELTGMRLLTEIRALGYAGGYSILKEYLQTQRPRRSVIFEQRFEVDPGEQAQVDFATFKTPFGTVYALLVVLSWSRALWVRFSFQQDQLTVLGGLHQAFQSFGGAPRTVLFDRMRTAVAGTDARGGAVFNAELLRFAAHCGIQPRACRPYRAQTKGRVERAVSYLRQGFFYGRSFRDLTDLNAQCAEWLATTANRRVHGTTGEIPAERLVREQAQLLPLPTVPYIPLVTVGRRVTRDGFISYNGNDYSVPDGLPTRTVQVRATLTDLRVVQGEEVIASHPLLAGRGQCRLDLQHRRGRSPEPSAPGEARHGLAAVADFIEVERRPLTIYDQVLG